MEEKSTTASRSIAVALIVLVLVALSVAMPSSWFGSKAKSENQKWEIDVSKIKVIKEVGEDADGDGTISWKEVVENTLPMTEEQKEQIKKLPIDQKAIDELNDPNNLTASFSKNLFLTVATIEKNKITDQQTKQALIDKITQEEVDKIQLATFTTKDIILAKTETKTSIKNYGNTIVPLLDDVLTKKTITGNMEAFANFINYQKGSDLNYLKEDKKRLDIIIKKMLAVNVPPSASELHTQTLIRVATYRDIVDGLSKADSDPMRTSLIVEQYVPVSRAVIEMFEKYAYYFNEQNITFTSTEPGYVFVIGYTLH